MSYKVIKICNTAGFTKTVPSVYTLLMNTIYLYNNTNEAEGTVSRKQKVCMYKESYYILTI